MRRGPFTPREHLAAGADLSEIRDRVTELWFAVADAYGKGAGAKLARVHKLLAAVASDLDDAVCREIPVPVQTIEGVPIIRVYYGWQHGPTPGLLGLDSTTARKRLRERGTRIFDAGNPWQGGAQ